MKRIHNISNIAGFRPDLNPVYEFGDKEEQQLHITVNGQPIVFNVFLAQIHRKESIESYLKKRPKANDVLFCNHLTDYLRQLCHESKINYADESGNARISTDGIYISIEGRPQRRQEKPSQFQFMSIGIMKCLFAFFSEKGLINETYANIAPKADISVGMVAKAMKYLVENNHIAKSKRQRRFLNEPVLQYEWLNSYGHTLARNHQITIYPPLTDWKDISLQPGDVWGGEVAAAQLTKYNRPCDILLFSRHQPIKYPIGHRELPPLKVVKPFWGATLTIGKPALALLTVAELLLSKDGRNRELAYLINDKHLKFNQLPL